MRNLWKINFIIFGLLFSVHHSIAIEQCEVNFVRYIHGEMPADITKNPTVNMWDLRFNPDRIISAMSKSSPADQRAYIQELTKLVNKDITYAENLSLLVNKLYDNKTINFKFIKRNFLDKEYNHINFHFSEARNQLSATGLIDPETIAYVKNMVKKFDLSEFYQREYTKTFLQSNRTIEEIEFALESGMKLRGDAQSLERFKLYMEFLDNTKSHNLEKGLKHIEDIYVKIPKKGILPFNPLVAPHKQFLKQTARLKEFQERRIIEIERGLKLQEDTSVVKEIDEAIQAKANGKIIKVQERLRFKRKIDNTQLTNSLKQRARMQAKHETSIYRRLLNGCNSGSSKRLDSAKKKFSRFKFAMSMGLTPVFYIKNSKDEMDTDPYYWEKLGHEMLMAFIFTKVGNKLFTNTSTTFWKKYFEGYIKFGALSYAEAYSYEELFGKNELIRYIQTIYTGEFRESELEKEYEKFVNSPNFEKNLKELTIYLEKMSKKQNMMNFLDKYFNLNAYSSGDEKLKITQEDLETEEAREFLMELIAERIYLTNMGNWEFFQTGRKDTDRFLFYRTRAVAWDIKGLAMNLTMFELMCREPFGKIGSWGAILTLFFGDMFLTGNLTYQYRRDAINQ